MDGSIHKEPTLSDVGKLIEVTNGDPGDPNCHWHTVRLAGIDMLEDLQYVCIPTEQRWINDCSSWEIGSWRHARTITKES